MSKVLKNVIASGFTDVLPAANTVRSALLRTSSKNPTARDLRREQGRSEGYAIGRQEGHAQGLAEGRQQAYEDVRRELEDKNHSLVTGFADSIGGLMAQAEAERQEFFRRAEQSLADLAIEIARRAIARELELSRESVVQIAHDVVSEATNATSLKLRVNPLDASSMEAQATNIKNAFAHVESVEIVEDGSIGFGCKLETDLGLIDARVEDFLARIVHESREKN